MFTGIFTRKELYYIYNHKDYARICKANPNTNDLLSSLIIDEVSIKDDIIFHFYAHGNNYWINSKNQFHRDENDLPAIIYNDGTQKWYINNELHRDIGPAVIGKNYEYWHFNDCNWTERVNIWIEENDFPFQYRDWTDEHKVLFKLGFDFNQI